MEPAETGPIRSPLAAILADVRFVVLTSSSNLAAGPDVW